MCECVCGAAGGGGGGGTRDTESKTRTPHKVVGKNLSDSLVKPPLVQEIGPPPDLDGQYEQ